MAHVAGLIISALIMAVAQLLQPHLPACPATLQLSRETHPPFPLSEWQDEQGDGAVAAGFLLQLVR